MRQKESKLKQSVDELRPEYDFSRGVRGKHAARYGAGTNVVVLEPDVASAFPTANDVNEALRTLAQIIRRRVSSSKRTYKPPSRAAKQSLRVEYSALSAYCNTIVTFRFTTLGFCLAALALICGGKTPSRSGEHSCLCPIS